MNASSLASLALCLILPATDAVADPQLISFEGRWHVDLEKSDNPYSSNTQSVHLDIVTDDGKLYEASETVIRRDGKTTSESVQVPVDGKFHSVKDSPSRASIAITRRALGSITIELRTPDGLHGRQICNLSPDKKAITCELINTDLKGKTTSAKAVYVRD